MSAAPEVKLLRPADRLLPLPVEQRLRRLVIDKFTGNVQLNIKDGRILGFHVHEIIAIVSSDT